MAKTEEPKGEKVEYASALEVEKAIQAADVEIGKWQVHKEQLVVQLDKFTITEKVDKTLGVMNPGERDVAIKRLTEQAAQDKVDADAAKVERDKALKEQAAEDEKTRAAVADAKKTAELKK